MNFVIGLVSFELIIATNCLLRFKGNFANKFKPTIRLSSKVLSQPHVTSGHG